MIMSLTSLETAIKKERLLNKYKLERIGVFGSYARGENANDIDFFIDIDSFDIRDLKELKEDLERITAKRVDIMLKRFANPIILHRAQKDMKYVTQWEKWPHVFIKYFRVSWKNLELYKKKSLKKRRFI